MSARRARRRKQRAAAAFGLDLAEYEEIERFSEWGDPEEELLYGLWGRFDAGDRKEAAAQLGAAFPDRVGLVDLTLAVPGSAARRPLGVAIFLALVVPTFGRFTEPWAWLLFCVASLAAALVLPRLLWSHGGARLRGLLRFAARFSYLLLPGGLALLAITSGFLSGPFEVGLGAFVVGVNALLLPEATRWTLRRRRRALARRLLARARRQREQLEPRVERRSGMLGALCARDPDFDELRFQERVARAFTVVQHALCSEDLDPIRPFVSDAVFERFELELAQRRAQGVRDELRRLFVLEVGVAHMETRERFDELSVGIQARGECVRLPRDTRDAPAHPLHPMGAFWTLVRRSGARTPEGAGLLEGQCPGCGAPVALNQSARCGSCQALLLSAEHDWILTEVTHPDEWAPRAPSRVPGIDRLREDDPAFGLHQIEDRAAVIFYRKLASDRCGRSAPIEAMATPEACEKVRRTGRPDRDHIIEIAAVETRSIAEAGDRFEARVRVLWRARPTHLPPGSGHSGLPDSTATSLVLARRRGVRSDPERSISSAHCPSCGAPDTGRGGGSCTFCGVRLNDGSRDWVLVDLEEA